jgi:hypothetical protein
VSLSPVMLKSAVRIASDGSFLGSGFLVGVPSEQEPRRRWPYVVTADHVVRNQPRTEVEVPDPLSEHGELHAPEQIEGWRQPFGGVDVSVAPYRHRPSDQVLTLDTDGHFMPPGAWPHLGSEIFYVGMFAPLAIPMARGGTLGAHYALIDKADGLQSYQYTAHLIDVRSYEGFSGSPCFSQVTFAQVDRTVDPPLYTDHMKREDGTDIKLAEALYIVGLCGMFTAHYDDERGRGGPVSNLGVGVMIPHDVIREAVMTEDAVEERKQWDAEYEEM